MGAEGKAVSIVVSGVGVAGLTAASVLARRGHSVTILGLNEYRCLTAGLPMADYAMRNGLVVYRTRFPDGGRSQDTFDPYSSTYRDPD